MENAYVVLFLIVLGALIAGRLYFHFLPARFCTVCHSTTRPKAKPMGNGAVEIILYLFFIVPGLIYTFYRVYSRRQVCRNCGSDRIVPPDSPIVAKITGSFPQQVEEPWNQGNFS